MRDLVKEGREILEKFSKMFEVGEDEDSYYDGKDGKNKKAPEKKYYRELFIKIIHYCFTTLLVKE